MPFLLFALLGYISFLLYQAVYFNYQTSQKIKSLKSDIAELNEQKEKLEDLIIYYQTDTFAELEARKKLGLKMPGEKVVKVDLIEQSRQAEEAPQDIVQGLVIPNWQKWIDYLQGKDF